MTFSNEKQKLEDIEDYIEKCEKRNYQLLRTTDLKESDARTKLNERLDVLSEVKQYIRNYD